VDKVVADNIKPLLLACNSDRSFVEDTPRPRATQCREPAGCIFDVRDRRIL